MFSMYALNVLTFKNIVVYVNVSGYLRLFVYIVILVLFKTYTTYVFVCISYKCYFNI